MRHSIRLYVVTAFILACCGNIIAADIVNFTVIKVSKKCTIKAKGETTFVNMKEGEAYPFGSVVKTGRKSFVDLQFSEGNTFRLLARTKLTIAENTKNPKLKILKLEKGSVNISLDKFPKDHKLKVETPTAVCGAVGTRFVVSFEDTEEKDGTGENRFECTKGEVFASSRFTVGEDSADDGQSFDVPSMPAGQAFTAVIHEGLENSYTDITVNRGKLTFEYGGEGETQFSTEEAKEGKPVRFVCALEKSDSDVGTVAMEVKSGMITNKKNRFILKDVETDLDSTSGAFVVSDKDVHGHTDNRVQDYIAAAKKEGEIHSKLRHIRTAGEADEAEIAKLEKDLRVAADDATAKRKMLLNVRTQRALKQIKRATRMNQRPQTPRRH